MLKRIILAQALGTMLLVLSGCATKYVNENDAAANNGDVGVNPVSYRLNAGFINSPPQCVAVLPLIDATHDADNTPISDPTNITELSADKLAALRWNLYSHLAPYPYRDVEIEHVDEVVNALGNTPGFYADIGRKLKCDALLVGKITSYRSDFLAFYSQTAIGADLKLIRAQTGEVLWQGHHVATSRAGSVPLTPIDLAVGLFSASENVSDEQVVHVGDDLFRRLLSTWDKKETDGEEHQEIVKVAQQTPDTTFNYYVTSSKLFLRSGPGMKFKAKDVLERNEHMEVVSIEHKPWVEVRMADGQSGYVHSRYISKDNQLDGLLLTDTHDQDLQVTR